MLVYLKKEEVFNERLCSVIEHAGVELLRALYAALAGKALVAWHDVKIVEKVKEWLKLCVEDGTLCSNREATAILMEQVEREEAVGELLTDEMPLPDEAGVELAEIPEDDGEDDETDGETGLDEAVEEVRQVFDVNSGRPG